MEGNGGEEWLFGDEEKRREEMGEEDREDGVRVFEEKKIENVNADSHDVWIGVLFLKNRRELGCQGCHVLVIRHAFGA